MIDIPGTMRRAKASHARGDLNAAIRLYRSVLQAAPRDFAANYFLAVALYQAGELKASVAHFDAAVAANPARLEALKDRGLILLKLEEYEAAEASLEAALRLDPLNPDLLVNRGIALNRIGRLDEAVKSYRAALELRPKFAEAHNNLGNSLKALGETGEALAHYDQAVAIKPGYAEAWFGAGTLLQDLKRNEEALQRFDKVLEIDPHHAAALFARGNIRESGGNLVEALADYGRALAVKPGQVEILLQMAEVLRREQRLDESLTLYDKAIAIAPDNAAAYYGVGRSFFDKKEFKEAAASFEEAIKYRPDSATYHLWCGRAFESISHYDRALSAFEKAIELQPDLVKAHDSAASIYSLLNRVDEALAALETVRRLMPGEDRYFSRRFLERMKMCDWADADAAMAEIVSQIEAGHRTIDPLSALYHLDSPQLQARCAEMAAARLEQSALAMNKPVVITREGRMVIGYYSGDFRNHAMMVLLSGLFELQDRERFRFVAFSFKNAPESEKRKRVIPCFDAFHDVDHMLDREVIALSRQENIHVAVDLMGYTRYNRPTVFMAGVAPIQVNDLGFPGTMGTSRMDYIIADPVLIPEDKRAFYSEKVAYLPNSYQPNDRKRVVADRIFTREELGLPPDAFVFCCFNQNFKISPEVFASWMRILRQAPGSVLWLLAYSKPVVRNLREAAESHGVDPERLLFASPVPLDEHLSRHRAADLFLDTLPYNAHTTASDALWTGLPVLTRMGQSFASRVAASLLTAAGLPELITTSIDEYEQLALRLYRERGTLAAMRERLVANRLTCALFDTERFARDLETLYAKMIDRHERGLPPDHLFV